MKVQTLHVRVSNMSSITTLVPVNRKKPSPSQTNANYSGAQRDPPPYSNVMRAENVTASYSEPLKFSL